MTYYPVADFPSYAIDPETQQVIGPLGKILKPSIDKRGRVWIRLYRDRKQFSRKLAHLMLTTFVGPPKPGEVSRHWDDNPGHNELFNLCWGTQSENMHDKVRNGLHWNANKTECGKGHPFDGGRPGNRWCKRCNADNARKRRAARAG